MKTPAQLMESALDKLEYAQDCIGGAKAQIKLALERQDGYISDSLAKRVEAATARIFGSTPKYCVCRTDLKDSYAKGPHHNLSCAFWAPEFRAPGAVRIEKVLVPQMAEYLVNWSAPGREATMDEPTTTPASVPTEPGATSSAYTCETIGHDFRPVSFGMLNFCARQNVGLVLTCRRCPAEESFKLSQPATGTVAGVV